MPSPQINIDDFPVKQLEYYLRMNAFSVDADLRAVIDNAIQQANTSKTGTITIDNKIFFNHIQEANKKHDNEKIALNQQNQVIMISGAVFLQTAFLLRQEKIKLLAEIRPLTEENRRLLDLARQTTHEQQILEKTKKGEKATELFNGFKITYETKTDNTYQAFAKKHPLNEQLNAFKEGGEAKKEDKKAVQKFIRHEYESRVALAYLQQPQSLAAAPSVRIMALEKVHDASNQQFHALNRMKDPEVIKQASDHFIKTGTENHAALKRNKIERANHLKTNPLPSALNSDIKNEKRVHHREILHQGHLVNKVDKKRQKLMATPKPTEKSQQPLPVAPTVDLIDLTDDRMAVATDNCVETLEMTLANFKTPTQNPFSPKEMRALRLLLAPQKSLDDLSKMAIENPDQFKALVDGAQAKFEDPDDKLLFAAATEKMAAQFKVEAEPEEVINFNLFDEPADEQRTTPSLR